MILTIIDNVLRLLAVGQFSFVLGVAIFVLIVWRNDPAHLYHVRPMIASYIILTGLGGWRLLYESENFGHFRLILCMVAFGLGDYALVKLVLRISKGNHK